MAAWRWTRIASVPGAALVLAAACGVGEPTLPDREEVLAQAQRAWDANHAALVASDRGDDACLRLPILPDMRKRPRPMAWQVEISLDDAASPSLAARSRQMDALADAGLLVRTPGEDADGKPVTRYESTEAGWLATQPRDPYCFNVGERSFAGIDGFRSGMRMKNRLIIVVQAREGLDASTLAPWARRPALAAAFPELAQWLAGATPREMLLQREGSGWFEPGPRGRIEPSAWLDRLGPEASLPTAAQADAAVLAFMTPPDDGHRCAPMLGQEHLPVDRDFHSDEPARYASAVFIERPATGYDGAVVRTLPFAAQLVSLGVLRREVRDAPRGSRASDGTAPADVFTLTPVFAERATNGPCFSTGPRRVRLLETRTARRSHDGAAMIRFRARLEYPDAPEWMRAPALLAGWPDLRGMIERGEACDGEFEYDADRPDHHPGGASCWPAYDSVLDD
jgi:hypothetical protein